MEPNPNYPETFQIMLFPTKEKKNERSPDFRISAKIGDDYKEAGAGWKKVGKNGPFLSLSVDLEVAKKLILEKLNPTTSKGEPIPFTEPEDPFNI